jgi:hypothetical protein
MGNDEFSFDELKGIEVHRNFKAMRGVQNFLSFDEYFYFKLNLQRGTYLILTSLLVESLNDLDPEQRKTIEVQRFIPFLGWEANIKS